MRICTESCFQYDPERGGCSYTQRDFTGVERIRPGEPCLHPEFDERQIIKTDIVAFCNFLVSGCSPEESD